MINSGKYSLDEHWNDPFKVENENSNENIYVVPFDANNALNFNFIEQNIHESIIVYKYAANPGDYYVIMAGERSVRRNHFMICIKRTTAALINGLSVLKLMWMKTDIPNPCYE